MEEGVPVVSKMTDEQERLVTQADWPINPFIRRVNAAKVRTKRMQKCKVLNNTCRVGLLVSAAGLSF